MTRSKQDPGVTPHGSSWVIEGGARRVPRAPHRLAFRPGTMSSEGSLLGWIAILCAAGGAGRRVATEGGPYQIPAW